MELQPGSPTVTVERARALLSDCLALLDRLELHQAAAYVDMALHATGGGARPGAGARRGSD
jgi:hypothetical protein